MDIGIVGSFEIVKNLEGVDFQIGESPPIVSGITELTQVVLITILTSGGSDKIDLGFGGGLLSMIGQNIDPNNFDAIRSRISQIVGETQRQILSEQSLAETPEESRLERITLVNVDYDRDLGEIQVELVIDNALGEKAYVRL